MQQEVQQFMDQNKKYLSPYYCSLIRDALLSVSPDVARKAMSVKIDKPSKITLISLFFGILGIDRFIVGDYIYGIIKLCTIGIFFIGWIIDVLFMGKFTKEFNSARILVECFPGKVKKPTMISRFSEYTKTNPDQIKSLIQSSRDFKESWYMH